MKNIRLWFLYIISVLLLCIVIWGVVNNIGNNIMSNLQWVQTYATVLALVGVIIAWISFRKDEKVKNEQLAKLEDIVLILQNSFKVSKESLEATKQQNNLFQLTSTTEKDSDKEKMLEEIISIEKDKQSLAIRPNFKIKGYAENLSRIRLINVGELAQNIESNFVLDGGKKIKVICDNTSYINNNESLVLNPNPDIIPDQFVLQVGYKDKAGVQFYQHIFRENQKLTITIPARPVIMKNNNTS